MSGTWNVVLGLVQLAMTGDEKDLVTENLGDVSHVSGLVFVSRCDVGSQIPTSDHQSIGPFWLLAV